MATYGSHGAGGAPNKITKQRAKIQVVKPILKKLSHSEKNSLDLDRGWEEQVVEQLGHPVWGGNYGSRSNSTKDVSFAIAGPFAASDTSNGGAGGAANASGGNARGKFQHGRSASQASTGSTSRGVFVHPFQQTPRTSTPPISYANSLASFDNAARDYSPTITENEDDEVTVAHQHQQHAIHHPPPTHSQSNIRRPSLASQRTASFSDITAPAGPLRINTGRSTPATASRLAHGSLTSAASHSDLHLNLALDSPSGIAPPSISSPTASVSTAPMSPLRSSLDIGFPRLRSRSELDTASRAEHIRAARRKFEERERVKTEKYDREMIRKRERRDAKQASRVEKESRKGSMSDIDRPQQTSQTQRPAASRKTTPTNVSSVSAPAVSNLGGSGGLSLGKGFWTGNSSRDALAGYGRHEEITGEKQPMDFASRQYESVPAGQTAPPAFGPAPLGRVHDVRFEQARPRRGSNAKKKTQTYWQGFILWLRTKILRMSGK
ncbi:hypothetical protein OQA88_3549 [Cercophora sp. LCS_1]